MKIKNIKSLLIYILPLLIIIILTSSMLSDNGKPGATGSPNEPTCHNCHNSYPIDTGGSIVIDTSIFSTGYIPGNTYNITITISKTGTQWFGIGIECLTSINQNAGALLITDVTSTQIKVININGVYRQNVVHKLGGGYGNNFREFHFDWIAPPSGTGPITFYFAGIASNSNYNESGDYVYTGSYTVNEGISTQINEIKYNNQDKIIKIIDISGKEITPETPGLKFYIYDSGKIVKTFTE